MPKDPYQNIQHEIQGTRRAEREVVQKRTRKRITEIRYLITQIPDEQAVKLQAELAFLECEVGSAAESRSLIEEQLREYILHCQAQQGATPDSPWQTFQENFERLFAYEHPYAKLYRTRYPNPFGKLSTDELRDRLRSKMTKYLFGVGREQILEVQNLEVLRYLEDFHSYTLGYGALYTLSHGDQIPYEKRLLDPMMDYLEQFDIGGETFGALDVKLQSHFLHLFEKLVIQRTPRVVGSADVAQKIIEPARSVIRKFFEYIPLREWHWLTSPQELHTEQIINMLEKHKESLSAREAVRILHWTLYALDTLRKLHAEENLAANITATELESLLKIIDRTCRRLSA